MIKLQTNEELLYTHNIHFVQLYFYLNFVTTTNKKKHNTVGKFLC